MHGVADGDLSQFLYIYYVYKEMSPHKNIKNFIYLVLMKSRQLRQEWPWEKCDAYKTSMHSASTWFKQQNGVLGCNKKCFQLVLHTIWQYTFLLTELTFWFKISLTKYISFSGS